MSIEDKDKIRRNKIDLAQIIQNRAMLKNVFGWTTPDYDVHSHLSVITP